MQKGLIDQDTGLVLLESQVIMSGLIAPETSEKLTLEEGLSRNLIDPQMFQQLQELQDALSLVNRLTGSKGLLLSVVDAIEKKIISQRVGLKILEAHLATGGFIFPLQEKCFNLDEAFQQGLIPTWLHSVLEYHLRSSKNLIDPSTAEKMCLLELMQRCIIHQESGLKFLPVKQLAGGMVSLKSGRKVSIFRAVQEGLIDRQVTVRLLEAQLFAGGIVDPRTGHRLTVQEAVRHNLIDQDMVCALLIRQLETGGIIDTVTGHRMTIDEAVRKNLVTAKFALVVLESLRSFMGVLWPESGEILPITDALEQGIVSTELAQKILSGRQHIKALFLPEAMEIWSWKEAVENGTLNKGLVNKMKSVCIPDVMPHKQLVGSSEQSKLNSNPSVAGLCTGQTEGIASHREEMLFQLMTHSYINVQNGQRLLLLDSELIDSLTTSVEYQASPQEVFGIGHQREGTPEELAELMDIKATETFCDVFQERPCELQVSSQSKECPDQANYIEAKSKKITEEKETEGSSVGNPEKDLLVGEQRVRNPNSQTSKSKSKVKSELRRQLLDTRKKDQIEMSAREDVTGEFLLTVPSKKAEDNAFVLGDNSFYVEPPREDNISLTCQKEQANKIEIECPPGKTGRPHIKLQSKMQQLQAEETVDLDSELKTKNTGNIYSHDQKEALNKRFSSRHVHKQSQDGLNIIDGNMMTLEKTEKEDGSSETSLAYVHSSELLEDATLTMLFEQLLDGGILHEQTGQKLLLNEAIAQGIVPSHTAVKLMAKMNMFRGFFDAQTCESLTTEEVIDEGLMDEKLLHNVLMADKTISGVLDPRTHTLCSVKEAVAVGLLDIQTATGILEGQVVTGGIVDLKRGKKISVTLASNLGLVDSADLTALINLEKASKGREVEKVVRERLINLQMETTGILDPANKAPLTVVQSIDRGLLETEEAIQLLTKQVVDGGIIHQISGMRLSVDNAFEHGIIDKDLAKQLKKVENIKRQQFFHPETKEAVSLPEAIQLDLVTPELNKEIQETQALTGNFMDLISGQKRTLTEAKKEGWLPSEGSLSSGIMHGILDPENHKIVPYSELVKKCKIDIESGKRYLEVIPFSDIKDGVSDKSLTLTQATELGKIDFASTLKILEAQANTGGIIDTATGQQLTLSSALEHKLIDESMIRIIASNQVVNGGIIDIFNNQRVTLKEAIEKQLINPELATMIQKDSLVPSDHGAQVKSQDGIEVSELKKDFLGKKTLTVCNQTDEMSCGKGEREKLFQNESQPAQEKAKVRISEEEHVKRRREISLRKNRDGDKKRGAPDLKDPVKIKIPSDIKGKSSLAHDSAVTQPHSEVCEFKDQKVARNDKGKSKNEEQEQILPQEEISQIGQCTSSLNSKEIRGNQGAHISEVQESNYETPGKLLDEQVVEKSRTTGEKNKRKRRRMVVEKNVPVCRQAVHSEKLNQESAVRDDHDSSLKDQPIEITTSEKEKETDRKQEFSVIWKTEDLSSQVVPRESSIRNQDALTFSNSSQISEREMKNLSLPVYVKPEENLSQEITDVTKGEQFSFVTSKPELSCQEESVGEAQSFQATIRQEASYKDSCITSKTKETKDLIFSSNEHKEKVPFDSTTANKLQEEIIVSRIESKEVNCPEFSVRKADLQDSKSDHELNGIPKSKVITQEVTGERSAETINPKVSTPGTGSYEGIVTQGDTRVLVSHIPEKLFNDVSQKESARQQDATISSSIPDTSENKTVEPLKSHSAIKTVEIPQEKLRESPRSEHTPYMAALEERVDESINLEPFRATKVSFPYFS